MRFKLGKFRIPELQWDYLTIGPKFETGKMNGKNQDQITKNQGNQMIRNTIRTHFRITWKTVIAPYSRIRCRASSNVLSGILFENYSVVYPRQPHWISQHPTSVLSTSTYHFAPLRRSGNFWQSLASLSLGFEVVRAVVIKSSIFWDITPYSPLKGNLRFGGTGRFLFRVEE
jgi:hypothetical protein